MLGVARVFAVALGGVARCASNDFVWRRSFDACAKARIASVKATFFG